MLRITGILGIALLAATGTAIAAPTAKLTNVSGPVLVDSGKGFVKVSGALDLAVGSRILLSKGAHATLAYMEGCSQKLSPNSITKVTNAKACKEAAQVAAADLIPEPAPIVAPVVAAPFDPAPLLFVGTALAAGGLGYWIGSSNSNDHYIAVYVPISK